MKRSILLFLSIGLCILIFPLLTSSTTTANNNNKSNLELDKNNGSGITPQKMPRVLDNGHRFPTDSVTINKWVANSYALNGLETNPDIISHAWGLWQALTKFTDEMHEGTPLRVFETWYTPQDVMKATMKNEPLPATLSNPGHIHGRNKFEGFDRFHGKVPGSDIVGKVKFSPVLARTALKKRFYDSGVMNAKKRPGKIETITLPKGAVALKPVYRVLTEKLKVYDGLYRFHKWSGKQDGLKDVSDFESYVYVCTNNNDPRIDNKDVFGINTFMHHKMTEAEAKNYNESSKEGNEYNNNIAKAGDIVIVLGMHVTTRELTRWAWQTFWWSPTPDNPVFPSSKLMADGRNTTPNLEKAARHYAVSVGYSLLSPAAPLNYNPGDNFRTDNRGSVFALNPYIEGTFTPDVFPNQQAYYDVNNMGNLFIPRNIDGLTSSCMGCHSQATYLGIGNEGKGASMFIADQYVPRNAPWFRGELQTDFLWSLTGSFERLPEGFKEFNNNQKTKYESKK